jgi:hypothetical protein
MLDRLLVRWGADPAQFRVLLRLFLRLDFRGASMAGVSSRGGAATGARALIIMAIMYTVAGAFLAVLVLANKNLFFTGTVYLTYLMVMIGAVVLMEFYSIITSPDEFGILGYRPLSSRTYFFAKITHFLVYTTGFTAVVGLLPVLAYFFTLGFHPLVGLAAMLASALCGITVALAMALAYTAIVRRVHPDRLRRILSYVQLLMSFMIYGGYIFVPEMISRQAVRGMSLPASPLMLLHPATWFAAYLELARGHWRPAYGVVVLVSLAVLVVLVRQVTGKLSLDYSESLARLTAGAEEKAKPAGRSTTWRMPFFRRNEERAVALLIQTQFKYDQKFRLTILGILPLTFLYLFMSLREGPLADPFIRSHGPADSRGTLIYLAVLLFPSMLRQGLAASDSFAASWVYFATPARPERIIAASRNFVMIYFVVPYLTLLWVLLSWFFRNPVHALVHLAILGAFTLFSLQLGNVFDPSLPFSKPAKRGERSGRLIGAWILVGTATVLFAVAGVPALSAWVYPSAVRTGLFLLVLVGVAYLLQQWEGRRVRRNVRSLQFQG